MPDQFVGEFLGCVSNQEELFPKKIVHVFV